jgi:hypothetical protein
VTTEVSGVDLVRQALLAAREQAKKNGTAVKKKPKRRARRAVRRDGREPLGLGEAIGMMMTERGLTVPAAGGSVLARWDNILAAAAAELVGHVQAVKFDSDTGRLDVAPDSPAYGTKLRWSAQALVAAANADVPDANVRALHILPPAAATVGPTTAAADTAADAAAEPAGPVRTREDASNGYRQALAAHQAAKAEQGDRLTPAVRTAIERQDQVLRGCREAEEVFADGQTALEELRTKAARSTSQDHARPRALQRLAAERASRALPALQARRTA